jgi:hypothetical protein
LISYTWLISLLDFIEFGYDVSRTEWTKWHLGFVCCLWWLCLCIAIQHRDNWSDVHACCIAYTLSEI